MIATAQPKSEEAAMTTSGPGPRCGIEKAHRHLDDTGSEMLELLLTDYEQHGWTDVDLAEATTALLADRDGAPEITWSIVKAHRARKCRCARASKGTT